MMRSRFFAALALSALVIGILGSGDIVMVGFGAGGGAGACVVSDTFNRADSTNLGSNWTERGTGDLEIFSNGLRALISSMSSAYYSGQAIRGVDQWCAFKLTETGSGSDNSGCILRFAPAGAGIGYAFGFDNPAFGSKATWDYWFDNTLTSQQTGDCGATAGADGDIIHVQVTGTGTNTIVKFWDSTTYLGDCNVADSNCGWGVPTCTFSNDPANAVNSGDYAGGFIAETATAGEIITDDFHAGTIDGGACL